MDLWTHAGLLSFENMQVLYSTLFCFHLVVNVADGPFQHLKDFLVCGRRVLSCPALLWFI